MTNKITAFLPFGGNDFTFKTVEEIQNSGLVEKIYLLSREDTKEKYNNCEILKIDSISGSKTFQQIKRIHRPISFFSLRRIL